MITLVGKSFNIYRLTEKEILGKVWGFHPYKILKYDKDSDCYILQKLFGDYSEEFYSRRIFWDRLAKKEVLRIGSKYIFS